MNNNVKGYTMIFLPPIFLYISSIKIPSMESSTPPTKDIKGIKELNPSKNNIKGTKQVKAQAGNSLMLTSYINTFFKSSPCDTKQVNVVITPMKRATDIIGPFKKYFNPIKADSVVSAPVMFNIKNVKNK